MWSAVGVGCILFTFGIDALIIAVILLFVPQVSTFLRSERDQRDHTIEKIRELHQAGKITEEDFETLERGLELMQTGREPFEKI